VGDHTPCWIAVLFRAVGLDTEQQLGNVRLLVSRTLTKSSYSTITACMLATSQAGTHKPVSSADTQTRPAAFSKYTYSQCDRIKYSLQCETQHLQYLGSFILQVVQTHVPQLQTK
jgi:hypothetical protein